MTRLLRFPLSAACTLSLLAAGCAGTPATRFYLLSTSLGAPVEVSSPLLIAVGPVSIPDYVDRQEIVTRGGANAVERAAYHQWAGSLGDMLPRVLIEDVGARLSGDRMVAFPAVENPNFDYRVAVDVNRFDVDESGQAVLSCGWQIYDRAGKKAVLASESSVRAQAPGPSYEERVAALSQAVGLLADDLARAVASLPR